MGFPLNSTVRIVSTKAKTGGGFSSVPEAATGSWQIPVGNRVGQKLPMRIVWPRPDNETDSNSYLRNANTNFTYKQPIAVQGGERPLKYEIISAPVGATITSEMQRTIDSATGKTIHTRQPDLGLVSWPTPTSGTQTFSIRVTDQKGDTVTVSWSVLVDNTKFVIVDSSVVTSGTGTWASPLKTFADLWKNSSVDATYANKIAYFKSGTYSITDGTGTVSVNPNVKPLAFIGADAATTTFSCTAGHFYVNRGDVAFSDITFSGSRSIDTDNRIIQISTKNSNYLFYNLKFTGQTIGTSGGDNPSCIMFTDDATYTQNIALINCATTSSCQIQLLVTFTSDGVCAEGNNLQGIASNASNNGACGIQFKDDTRNATSAFNYIKGDYANGLIRISNQQNTLGGSANQEVCFNVLIDTASSWDFSSACMPWNQNSTAFANPINTFSYRNTIKTIKYAHAFRDWTSNGNPVKTTGNAYFAYAFSAGNSYIEVAPNSVALLTADIDDTTGALTNTNTARTTYLGKLGAEISS